MILFSVDTPPEPNPLIQTVIEQKVEVQPPVVEYTIEQKIKDNFYKCDENTQYIRRDTAECIEKKVEAYSNPQNKRETIKNSSNGYSRGYCTWYVANKRYVPSGLGDANTWYSRASHYGLSVGSKPAVGAIAQTSVGPLGHVAYVESVNGDMVTISEMNYVGWNRVSTRTVPASTFRYIY